MIDLPGDIGPIDLRGGQVLSGFVSHHHSPPPRHAGFKEWNENNVGLGYKTKNGFVLMPYMNSEHRPSLLSAYEVDLVKGEAPRISAAAGLRAGMGLVIGYKHIPLAPAAYPSAFVSIGGLELVVGHIPRLGQLNNSAVTWAQLRYKN